MTALSVSHEVADVDVVLIRFKGNGAPFSVPLSVRQAKRLAWGLLADLDPDEAAKAAAEQPARRRRPVTSREDRDLAKTKRYLGALIEGPLTPSELAAELGTSRGRANQEMTRLIGAGLAEKRGRYLGRFALTDAGRKFVGAPQ